MYSCLEAPSVCLARSAPVQLCILSSTDRGMGRLVLNSFDVGVFFLSSSGIPSQAAWFWQH
jgi:hypothetical protein